MRRTILFFFILCGILFSGCHSDPGLIGETSYTAVEKDPERELLRGIDELTLENACRIALRNNPTYQDARLAIESARMRYYQALGAYSPTLQAGFVLGDQIFNGSSNQGMFPDDSRSFYTFTTVQASWLIFDGLVRELTWMAAQKTLEMQQDLQRAARLSLLRGVAYAYDDILLSLDEIRIAEADLAFQQEMYQDALSRHRAGVIPESIVLNFQGSVIAAEENRNSARYHFQLGCYSLAVLMGYVRGDLPPGLRFAALPAPGAIEPMAVELYLDTALANRPDLAAFRKLVRISEFQRYQKLGAFSPTASAFANYSYSSSTTEDSGNIGIGMNNFFLRGGSFSYGMFAEWTIFNGLIRYHQLKEAEINLESMRNEGASRWLNAVHEVRSAYSNRAYCRTQLELAGRKREIMFRQRDFVAGEYRAGTVDVTRLNEAQLNLTRAETALASARIKLHKAEQQLATAIGRSPLDAIALEPEDKY